MPSSPKMSAHDLALEYAKSKLDEAYRREESIKESASMQIAVFSFMITGIITLEVGLLENHFKFFVLSLIFSSIVIFTMLLAVFFAILSQWRMIRKHFPKAESVTMLLNEANEDDKERVGKEQLIACYAQAADSMDNNNDKRTNRILATHILAIVSIIEMFVFSFAVFVVVLAA